MGVNRFVTMALLFTLVGCGGPEVAHERARPRSPPRSRHRVPLATSTPSPRANRRGGPTSCSSSWTTSRWTCSPRCAARRSCGARARPTLTPSSSTRSAVSRVRPDDRPVPTPDRGPDQTARGERSMPLGGFDAYDAFGNAERTFNVSLQLRDTRPASSASSSTTTRDMAGPHPPRCRAGRSSRRCSARPMTGGTSGPQARADGRIHVARHPAPPAEASPDEKDKAYAGTDRARPRCDFIRRHGDDEAPYFLEVAPYGPHSRTRCGVATTPATPCSPPCSATGPATAPGRELRPALVPGTRHEDLPGYGKASADNSPKDPQRERRPSLVHRVPPEPPQRPAGLARPSPDGAVHRPDDAANPGAVDDNTYVVLTSDNGFHLGQTGLSVGKGTPFDADVHVPLLVVGPGVEPGARDTMTSNIDLASTFEDLAGVPSAGVPLRTLPRRDLRRPAGAGA